LRPEFRPLPGAEKLWRSSAFDAADRVAARIAEGEIDLLGLPKPYPPRSWTGDGLESIRAFHLHYGEDILGCARAGGARVIEAARRGLSDWIAANPPPSGVGWHPYPLSTRIGNWVAALTLEPSLASNEIAASLGAQLSYLSKNVEDEILGNHVIRNARALVLGGAALGDDGILTQGIALLERELAEQILPDGGHYERSPAYHLIVLLDLLEVQAVAPSARLREAIARMRDFAATMMRPDGRAGLFNDAPLDLTPTIDGLPVPPPGLDVRRDTGYAVVRRDDLWLAFDVGRPAPDYLPPHAHADALSIQIWHGNAAVVVDPGMPTYDPGPVRDWFRGTKAHATVVIDGRDQFELWNAFRAGPFPAVELLEAEGDASAGVVRARVGRIRGLAGVVHERAVRWSAGEVVVEDVVSGRGVHTIESSLPLSAGIEVDRPPAVVAGVVVNPFGPLHWTVERRSLAEHLFRTIDAPAIVLRGDARLPVSFGWRFVLQGT
jgi:hypothetical protein